jgi:hypothetical protein
VVRARGTSLGGSTSTATPGRMLFGGSSTSGQAPRTCGSATKPRTAARSSLSRSSSVEATNDGYAPVSKLSAWLEDDPTSNKKKLPLASRRGRNVSAKSRKFEPLPPNDATRTVEFRRNGVSERKQWLESAFKKDGDGANKAGGQGEDGMSVADRAKWLQGAFAKKKEENCKVRRDDDGHANVAYAEVGPEEEFIASGGAGDFAAAVDEELNGPNSREDDNNTLTSSSTCSSFSIGKQMLESRTEKNSSRGVGQQPQEEEEEDLRASVQIRRAALEQREEESRAHADADRRRSVGRAVRAHWEVGGGSASAQSYTKTYVPEDDRRCTPAKKLSDLP